MGAYGCINKEGSKNKAKRGINGRAGHVFVLCDHGEKNQELGRDDHGDQRGTRGTIEGEQGVRGPS